MKKNYLYMLSICIGFILNVNNINAASILDQSYAPDLLNSTSSVTLGARQAQTFTVGLTGTLTQVDVMFRPIDYLSENEVFVDIRRTNNGAPSDNINDIIETTVLDPTAFLPDSFNSFFFDLAVNEGELLAVVIYTNGDANTGLWGNASQDNQYLGGSLWTSADLYGGNWYPNANSSDQNFDLAFKTYVSTVPIPTSIWLLLSSLFVMARFSVRRKK